MHANRTTYEIVQPGDTFAKVEASLAESDEVDVESIAKVMDSRTTRSSLQSINCGNRAQMLLIASQPCKMFRTVRIARVRSLYLVSWLHVPIRNT
jgi:hypothetical protein